MCPNCQDDARFVGRRGKQVVSLLGELRLRRCYYHCPQCGRGHLPWDAELGLAASARLTPAACEATCIAAS